MVLPVIRSIVRRRRLFGCTIRDGLAKLSLLGCGRPSIVLELVFLVDPLAMLARRRALVRAERSRHELLARGVGIALHGARGDLLAGDGGGLADQAPRGAAHQIDVDVIVMIGVRAGREHCRELLAGGGLDVAQEALLFRQTMPAVLHRDMAPIGEREARDVERIAKGVFGNPLSGSARGRN
jgi:hypothetical protein